MEGDRAAEAPGGTNPAEAPGGTNPAEAPGGGDSGAGPGADAPPEGAPGDGPDAAGLERQLESERERSAGLEAKLRRALADCENLSKKASADIEGGVNARVGAVMLELVGILDDLARAREAVEGPGAEGLDGILKNMGSLLARHGVTPIEALGGAFDPAYHEAVSVVDDGTVEDGTITREIRKGYISASGVLRPTLVEISRR